MFTNDHCEGRLGRLWATEDAAGKAYYNADELVYNNVRKNKILELLGAKVEAQDICNMLNVPRAFVNSIKVGI